MMNKSVFVVVFCCFLLPLFGQDKEPAMDEKQDPEIIQMRKLGTTMINATMFENRRDANYAFIRRLTKYLTKPNSFTLSLEEIPFVSVQTPKDSSFRIITWQLETVPGLVRHYGAIQMNQEELKLIPLVDRSDDMEEPDNYIGDNKHWYGAIYYDIQPFNTSKGKGYLLYGFDENSPVSNQKILDILYISQSGDKLLFGAPIFPNYHLPHKQATRFILEYKEDAAVRLRYDADRKQVVFDHIVPIDEASEGIYSNYVPDGTFDSLGFDNNNFFLVDDVIEVRPTVFEAKKLKEIKSNSIYKTQGKQ